MAQSLLYAGWIATRLGWRRHKTLEPLSDGAFDLRLEGRHEMVDLRIEPTATDEVAPGELLSVRLSSLGETGAAEFIIDRDGRGRDGRHERRRHDGAPAAGADGARRASRSC